ncbi:MAG: TIGR00282 family metallophosphoesterase [Nitrospirae bacterium]|nr:TIGR00282 family metallophosphoesterase [Nitrospirota bacterium]
MRILFIGDIIGEIGRKTITRRLDTLVDEYRINLVIANGENAAGGFGITPKVADELFDAGIKVITSGNHIWDKKEIVPYIEKERRLLRPANYPEGVPGYGDITVYTNSGDKVVVLNLTGRVFMGNFDCPFRYFKRELQRLKAAGAVIVVDFHAEATSEKVAFGWFADGEVSAIIGTHTHVQTADEQILPKGTAYITDVGMTGPANSVIGIEKDMVIEKYLTLMPRRFEVAKGMPVLSAAVIDINEKDGKAISIERLQIRDGHST